tara:strand:+ start:10760 stop:10984 length:225 start_codon:yes stop_codon:yes gene_type:complete
MSRTFRNLEGMHRGALRFPHTFNEIRQLDGLLHDEELTEYPLSGFNHMNVKKNQLPTSWQDVVVSAHYESDYQK